VGRRCARPRARGGSNLHLEAPLDAAWDSLMDAAQRQVTGAEFRAVIYRFWPLWRDLHNGQKRSHSSIRQLSVKRTYMSDGSDLGVLTSSQSGNFNSRSIAWKRGSLRKGSRSALVFTSSRSGRRWRIAVSSQSSARDGAPHCA
jgi:hypothetical protein